MRLYLMIFLVAAVVTWGSSWVVYRLSLRWKLAPAVRERDMHSQPTPRLGGVAMFIGLVAAFGVAALVPLQIFQIIFDDPGPIWGILGAALIIVVLGAADDLLDLDWMLKLAVQMIAAVILAWQSIQIVSLPIGNSIAVASPLVNLLLTVGLVVLVMNAINFIDGLDGLVAGVALIANGVFFLYSYLLVAETSPNNHFNLASLVAIILVGVCAGFLPMNWHQAKMFMGDSGALMVGLMMAVSTISVTGQLNPASLESRVLWAAYIPILLPVAVMIVPLLDFFLAVIRRVQAGKSPFSADRQHLHHRLIDMGHSHVRAVLIFYCWTAVLSGGLLLVFMTGSFVWSVVALVLGCFGCLWLTLVPKGTERGGAVLLSRLAFPWVRLGQVLNRRVFRRNGVLE